jgi:soluble lytic murein transglycosylase-like protein
MIYFLNTIVGAFTQNYEECFKQAALHYKLPANLLKIIAIVESNMDAGAIHINQNGSYDVGLMQINSFWINKLAHIGIQRGELLQGCTNIQIGAWILAQQVKRYGLSLDAIGSYNSSNNYYKAKYVNKIIAQYKIYTHQNLNSNKYESFQRKY